MKKKYLISICLFISVIQTLKAQVLQDSISVVISPGTTNTKVISDVETIIKSQSGVSFEGYCSNHNIYLLTVDSNLFSTSQQYLENLKILANVPSLLLKEGGKSGIIPFCEFNTIKKNQNPDFEKALLDK